jgi:hypothetical protein
MMKDKKKIVAELHHRKQEKNEFPTLLGKKVPVISSVYDPLTGMRDGTITSNAPVVITGENLCLSSPGTIYLGLSPVSDKGTLIHVKRVFKYTDTEVLVILPDLEPGEYSPVMMIHTGEKVDFTYTLPVSWKVLDERYVNLFVRRSCSDLI